MILESVSQLTLCSLLFVYCLDCIHRCFAHYTFKGFVYSDRLPHMIFSPLQILISAFVFQLKYSIPSITPPLSLWRNQISLLQYELCILPFSNTILTFYNLSMAIILKFSSLFGFMCREYLFCSNCHGVCLKYSHPNVFFSLFKYMNESSREVP